MSDVTTCESRPKDAAEAGGTAPMRSRSLRDQVREIIRAEVARRRPLEDARRSLELIVETSLRYSQADGAPVIKVVDQNGHPRTIRRNGQPAAMTVGDVVEELRLQHPNLFRPAEEPAVPRGGGAQAPARQERDWLNLTSGSPSPAARPSLPGQDPSRPADEGAGPTGPQTGARRRRGAAGTRLAARLRSVQDGLPDGLSRARSALRMMHDRVPRMRWPLAAAATVLLAAGAVSLFGRDVSVPWQSEPRAEAPAASEPASTGSISAAEQPKAADESGPQEPAAQADAGSLRGVADVVDTSTLRIEGKIVRLFGVEWARGAGKPEDLGAYLRGREVACELAPSGETYRCQVEGQDLSRVVLFNGGGRATAEATPELKAAEDKARSARVGVWSR